MRIRSMVMVGVVITAGLMAPIPSAAADCTAGVTVPDIKRVGFPFFDRVMVYTIGNGSCPGPEVTGVVVCLSGLDDRCLFDANIQGGVAGPVEVQAVCYALTPYYAGAAAWDSNDTPDQTINGPVSFSLDDCPPVPDITPDP